MEANLCDINHLDSDVLLPPRKRLLAGFKKQNSDGNSHQPSTSSPSSEFETRLNNLMRSHVTNSNFSPEEIAKASRSAAEAAAKAAKAARNAAEDKAAIAARAIAAAKSALELVDTISKGATSKDKYSKKNKMKQRHLPVQTLYKKPRRAENCKTDEELAIKLHRAMNSSPRISKTSPTSEAKNTKPKRLKVLYTPEKTRNINGVIEWEGDSAFTSNGNGVIGEAGSESSIQKGNAVRIDVNRPEFIKADRLKMDEEAETSYLKEKMLESSDDTWSIGRKRGRIKQKKLPLSICTFRDRANPKEDLKADSSPSTEENTGKANSNNKPSFSVEHSMPVETTSMWKCQAAFKAPVCVKQNKVIQ
ncbi:uncharacterized protein LOC130758258 [Actinidia eriantha]|uniref:uncharacterized protein LOC130758258 n=1 Tax=Actinidia eriantha TaxID=165200 RepID=UPI00258F7111|nr:uncharacterized protein LOC130758258 [Actinidia eriantha]XP_057469085.1 uncharacterized protein LOC130758258 [Actinidia eriantha]XP_057469086.1 uncharacterized protein LOC130758258 [Actinidia eriantha]